MQSLEIVNVYKVKLFRELYFIVILIYDIYRSFTNNRFAIKLGKTSNFRNKKIKT